MKTIFRVDGGAEGLGLGHIMRCIAIADVLKPSDVTLSFIAKNHPKGIEVIKHYGYDVIPLSPTLSLDQDAEETIHASNDADCILVDSHLHPTAYFTKLKKSTKLIVAIDDMAERELPVDVVIGNSYATYDLYHKLIPPTTLLLGGPRYLPLRKQFQNCPSFTANEAIKTVLISLGGEDPHNYTKAVVEALHHYPQSLTLNILIGNAYRHKEELQKVLSLTHHNYQLFENIEDVVTLFRRADVAITAAGVTIGELAAIGVPIIALQTADNQQLVIQYIQEHALAEVASSPHDIPSLLTKLQDQKTRQSYSQKLHSTIDGKGAERIAEALVALYTVNLQEVLHINPECKESQLLWLWRNDPHTRKMSLTDEITSWDMHKAWYEKKVQDPHCVMFIAYKDDQPIGMVRFDPVEDERAEVHINMNPDFRGKGLGMILLHKACIAIQPKTIIARIKPSNSASLQLFEKVGFQKAQEDDFLVYQKRVVL